MLKPSAIPPAGPRASPALLQAPPAPGHALAAGALPAPRGSAGGTLAASPLLCLTRSNSKGADSLCAASSATGAAEPSQDRLAQSTQEGITAWHKDFLLTHIEQRANKQ